MILVTDFDGVLTPQTKIRDIESNVVYKQVSDHDSYVADVLAKHGQIIVVSGDKRVNEAWCRKKNIPFIYVEPGKDKWPELKKYFKNNFDKVPEFAYIGDSLPDLNCLNNATVAIYPQDASWLMVTQITNDHAYPADINGGDGVLDYIIYHILPEEFLKYFIKKESK